MVKVCNVCGDQGFTDLLFICSQCNDLAEHAYCRQTLSETLPEADWSCVECKLKQKASAQKISPISSHPLVRQSESKSNKRQREDTSSIPVSKKQAVESSNAESLLQRDSLLLALEAPKGVICAGSQEIDISLHSRDGLPKVPQTGKFDCGTTTLLQDNGCSERPLCKDKPPKILRYQHSSSSMAQVASAGSKRQFLDKSLDPLPPFLLSSRPAASARGQRTFKSCKEIGSGNGKSSLHDKSSELKATLEHENKLKELVPGISGKDMETTKNSSTLLKGNTEGSELGKNPKDSTFLGVEKEDCRCLMPKVKSTGSSSKKLKLDKNGCNDTISTNDVFERSKSVNDDHQTLVSSSGAFLPRAEGQSSVASVEKASMKTLHCQHIGQPSTVYQPDAVGPFLHQLNSGENNGSIAKDDIDKVLSCSADEAFEAKKNNVNEQAHESDNSTIRQKTLPVYEEGKKLDANAGALHDAAQKPSNGHPEAQFNRGDNHLKLGATTHAPINCSQERGVAADMAHSMTRSLEIKLSSSSAMQNDPSYPRERAGMPGSLPSSMHVASLRHLPHQKQLTIPEFHFLWKGAFKVMGNVCRHCIYDGIQAHPSNTASPKVIELTKRFSPQLPLEQVQRCDAWPKRFHEVPPTDDNIGLYFFPTNDERCQKSYAKLLKEANDHDLAMRTYLDSAELLIFSSIQLPECFQSICGKFYFWGVFRGSGNSPSVCKVQEILSPSKHVGDNVIQADSSVPSVTTTRVLMLPDMHRHGGGEECMEIDIKCQNRKPDFGSQHHEFSHGFHTASNSAPPLSSDHLLEKQGFERFQAEPVRKYENEKEMVPRGQHRAYLPRQNGSCRKNADWPRNSNQSSLSSGQSDHSYGSKELSISPLALGKNKGSRCDNAIDINRNWNFKESHIHKQTRREDEVKEASREYAKERTGRHKEKWSHRPRIHFRTAQLEHQRRKHDEVNNRGGSQSVSCSHSCSSRSRSRSQSQSYKRLCSLSVSKPRSPDAGIVVPCTVNSSDPCLHKSNNHEKPLLQRDSSSEGNIDNRRCNDKGRAVMGGDNCRTGEKETSSENRVEKISLLDVEEGFSIRSPEASGGPDQPTKDQWSFTPLQSVTDEAAEKCNVSEVSNAASLPESPLSMCSGENIPHELTEADLSGVVNPRTEQVAGPGDHCPVTERDRWYTGSSSEQTDPEPVPCLELFPLEEENLGMAKNVVNNWDIDLELGLGRSCSKKRLPVFEQASCEKFNPVSIVGNEVFSNGSEMECSPCENRLDVGSILSLSVPHIQR